MADSDSTVETTGKITANLGSAKDNAKGLADELSRAKKEAKDFENTTRTPGSTSTGNTSTSQTPITTGGGGFGGQGGFGSGQTPYQSGMPSGGNYSGGGFLGGLGSIANFGANILGKMAGLAGAAADIFPTAQEALTADLMAQRVGFYGASRAGAGTAQRLAQMGTSTDALDAIRAVSSGAGLGLLPGLSNFDTGTFAGITGGAALMSNLVPGMGIQAGMQAMATLNQASNVNRLRMIGINVRTSDGTSMADLPGIIDQLYGMLKQSAGGDFSPQDIAVSAMSGNALDSILRQYFPSPDLRQAILAGLIQKARTKESIGISGTIGELTKTGGTTAAAQGIAGRNAAELAMIQSLTGTTLQGLNRGTAALTDIYGTMAQAGGTKLLGMDVGKTMGALAEAKTGLDVLAGGRGGSIGNLLQTVSNLGTGNIITSAITQGLATFLEAGLLVSSPNTGGRIQTTTGAAPVTVNNYITLPSGTTELSAQQLGVAVGNAINTETLAQLAAAKM
jgi:hypothetical protein